MNGRRISQASDSFTPCAYGFDISNDGTLQTPGATKKMGLKLTSCSRAGRRQFSLTS
jgi:hypothetical protein